MKLPKNPTDEPTEEAEYRYIEYESADDTVAVIQDGDNENAWIQSTVSEPVRR
ncbi:hypothetical protein [Halogeometricum limi]|uniref:Uncharacterized protein n=1 Tax=Halogeometricum limi TaxID=555875 RepID=A0A1I6FWS7_9EURY|nr:hypothetical protein [Halogeometricum limi]SFR34336.1 hypothetical protein SAMN04488124_0443 [Halogeometricum limi]